MVTIAYAALWVFVFSLPWEILTASSGVNLVSRLMGIIAASLALLAVVISGRVRRWHMFHVGALLFLAWAAFGMFVRHPQQLPLKFRTFVQLTLVLWMIWELAPSKKKVLGLLTAYVFGSYVAALATILMFRREEALLRRFAAGGADPNDVAMTLALALPMAWYLGTTYRHVLLRWACRAYIPLGLVAIGLTGSRGGMLTSMVAMMVVPLTMTRLTPARLASVILVLGISGALAVAFVPEKIVKRLATTGTQVEDLSLGGRFTIWVAGIRAFVRQPVMGYGTGTFKIAVAPWGSDQVAHNSYLSVLVEEGMVGLAFYLTMFGAVFVALWRLPLLERRFALVLLTTLCVAILPLTWEDRKAVWFILGALFALTQADVAGAGRAAALLERHRAPLVGRARPLEPVPTPGPSARRDAAR